MWMNKECVVLQTAWTGSHARGAAKLRESRLQTTSIYLTPPLTTSHPETTELSDLLRFISADIPIETIDEDGNVLVERLDKDDHLILEQDHRAGIAVPRWQAVCFLAGAGFVVFTIGWLRRGLR
jgi:hypothetical protein